LSSIASMTSHRSPGVLTNDCATQSMPASSAASRKRLSRSVKEASARLESGKFIPFSWSSMPPSITSHAISLPSIFFTTSLISPSSMKTRSPGLRSCGSPG
jgi:hypothetical protein